MYWTPAKMLQLADVDEYSFANAAMHMAPVLILNTLPTHYLKSKDVNFFFFKHPFFNRVEWYKFRAGNNLKPSSINHGKISSPFNSGIRPRGRNIS